MKPFFRKFGVYFLASVWKPFKLEEHTFILTSHLGQMRLAEVWKVKAHGVGQDEPVGPVAPRGRPQHGANLVELVNLGRSWKKVQI